MFLARHGEKGIKQLNRIQRQHERLAITANTIKRERGMDIFTGREIIIPPDILHLDNWSTSFKRLIAGVRENGVAVVEIEGALQVVGYKNDMERDSLGAAAHGIYHMLERQKPCLLEDDAETELKQMRDRLEPLMNFRSSIYYGDFLAPWMLGEEDLILDIVFGRIVVVMHLDPYGLIQLSEKMKLPLRWATRAERAKDANSPIGLQAVRFRNGILVTAADEPKMFVAPGWVKRVMFDLILPSSLVRGGYEGREVMIREAKLSGWGRTKPTA